MRDKPPIPGDLALARGAEPIPTFSERVYNGKFRVGTAMPGSLAVVVTTLADGRADWTYVLWSCPCVAGWVPTGFLRRVT